MSSYDKIYEKMASSLEQSGAGKPHEQKFDAARHMAPLVAHELNNILMIIQGYTDQLLIKHGEDSRLQPELKLISEAARHAALLVRGATPPDAAKILPQRAKADSGRASA